MSVQTQNSTIHAAHAATDAHPAAWEPLDAYFMKLRLHEIARCRPNAVATAIEHWMATPYGESEFDVKG